MALARNRLLVALSIYGADKLHRFLFHSVENSVLGMLQYHGGAALFDFATIIIAAHLLTGRLSCDMQDLCFCSMVTNFIGWLSYLCWISPIPYNLMIEALGYSQMLRLLWTDNNAAHNLGSDLVHRDYFGGKKFYITETNR